MNDNPVRGLASVIIPCWNRNRPVKYTRLNARGRRASCVARLRARPAAGAIRARTVPSRTTTPSTSRRVTRAVTPPASSPLPPVLPSTDPAATLGFAERDAC
jgi:hypothetical protein